ncbi:uncharacterized protein LOC108602982 [Drosophila busckii]|uniref:uncharacterized protein LOC108602982 n=1 Tax=Drosophila busckii TaxID=30019 RepID=UPI001432F55F|nr:uncharacterized protein LOC108602982 [Drosophila busckii]
MKYYCPILLLIAFGVLQQTNGHGMMLNPAGRSSRWRDDSSAPTNYDDNALYCGGLWKLVENKACGLCGDDYSMSVPRPNELGGTYGQGKIVRSYYASGFVYVNVLITVNHLGYFKFELCNLDEFGSESEECFQKNPLEFLNGSNKYEIGERRGEIPVAIKLTEGLVCKHCVLRWTYTAGNNWGADQETFKNCADISILGSARSVIDNSVQAELPVEVQEAAEA